MKFEPEALQRLHRVFFPESPLPVEWYERLAGQLRDHGTDWVDVIAYFRTMSLHKNGSSCGNPAVTDSVRAPLGSLKHFGSRVTLLIPVSASERWLEHVIEFYAGIGIPPVFAVNSATSDCARSVLTRKRAACIDIGGESAVEPLTAALFAKIGSEWILRVDEDELPTPALLNFVDRAVEHSTEFVWGFPRVYCKYDAWSDELQYSQFLPFGPFASAALQWRLFARDCGAKERRSALSEAQLLSFDWLLRAFSERVCQFERREADGTQPQALSHFYLQEAIPERWHMFAPLPNEKYREFARISHHAKTRKRERPHDDSVGAMCAESSIATNNLLSQDPSVLRDKIIAEASHHFERFDILRGVGALEKLRWATIDNETLVRTDPYLAQIATGKRIIASFDPYRIPSDGEIVIIYGNYPHIFENVVVNNPIKRHVAAFGEFSYDDVEYDHRWDGIGQIYIINADDRPDRYDGVLRELAAARAPFHRITRIPAIRDYTTGLPAVDGQIGCLRSHIETLRRAKSGNFGQVLVLEDDFCFTSEVDRHLDDLQAFLSRGYEYLVCLLATSKYGRVIPKDQLVCVSLQPCTNTGAYLVSVVGIERLLPVQEFALGRLKETQDTLKYAVDRCWSVLQSSGQFLVFRRKFGFQNSSFSDIERSISRYLD